MIACSLQAVIAGIRTRNRELDPDELDALIESVKSFSGNHWSGKERTCAREPRPAGH